MYSSTSIKFLAILILFGVCIDALSWKKRLRLRPFAFLKAFYGTGELNYDGNFVLLQIFQPMTAQISNIDCRAVFALVERCVEGQNFHYVIVRQ